MNDSKVDPTNPFYLASSVDNLDGTLELEVDGWVARTTKSEAIEHAREECNDHGSQFFIYRCTPVAKVTRVNVRVEELE
jgi:hypothetical protein